VKWLRRLAGLVVVLIVCAPAAFILTVLLSPFWSWVEATYSIESIGHSGPSDWCFYLTYFFVAGAGLLVYWRLVGNRADPRCESRV
jgi:hypothetical protein